MFIEWSEPHNSTIQAGGQLYLVQGAEDGDADVRHRQVEEEVVGDSPHAYKRQIPRI